MSAGTEPGARVMTLPRQLTREQARLVERSQVAARLASSMANRTSTLSRDELRSIAHESLIRAAQRFDSSRGVPFDGYAFRFVRLDLLRAMGAEGAHKKTELPILSAGHEALDGLGMPDPFASSAEHTRALADALDGMFAEVIARYLGAASRGLDEADLGLRDRAARFRRTLDDLGPSAEVLRLRYVDELGWDDVAASLGVSVATARRAHDAVLRVVTARLTGAAPTT